MSQKFKVTYATLAADNEELQSALDEAIYQVKASRLGVEVPMFINGGKIYADEKVESYSPISTDMHLCTAQKGTAEQARAAIAAARAAFPAWRKTAWQERVTLIQKIAEKLDDKILELSALLTLEVGKNRLEAIAEVTETVDLLRYYAGSMKQNHGFVNELGKLDPNDPKEHNFSVLRPHGVWVVISPFNFPMALSAAPIAAALLTGNTVVFKSSLDTPYSGWKAAELFAEAGLPTGAFNYVSGPGSVVGQELQDNPGVDAWTFTGSYDVGMTILKKAAGGLYRRPAIIEMGGKNPTIVSKTANLAEAAIGVMRAAFGMSGQKCSACSRVYVQEDVYEQFKAELVKVTRAIRVGDPTRRDSFMGPVINKKAYEDYRRYAQMAQAHGTVLAGGNELTEGEFARGYFVEPTIVEGLPEDHELVRRELFVPILHIARVKTLAEAMEKANDTIYGLTAGFFGQDEREIEWFCENILAGTIYINRVAGATTGAWPGVQAFGGWKGSGSSGKGIGGLYTLALYMHEQSRTIIG